MERRLDMAGEETLLSLLEQRDSGEGGLAAADAQRRLLLSAGREDDEAVLEFIAAGGEANIEDQMAVAGEHAVDEPSGAIMSLRLLRHASSSVHHQQYHDIDIVTVRVQVPADAAGS